MHLRGIGDIGGVRTHREPIGVKLRGERFDPFGINIGSENVCAAFRCEGGNETTESTRGPGHDDRFSCEVSIVGSSHDRDRIAGR